MLAAQGGGYKAITLQTLQRDLELTQTHFIAKICSSLGMRLKSKYKEI